MKHALFSDVHGNLEAFQAVVRDGREQAVGQWLCLGDTVGYGGDPQACLALARSLGGPMVRGNHDDETGHGGVVSHFSPLAVAGVLYSRRMLSAEERAFLAALPLRLEVGDCTLVHATLDRPEGWEYIVSPAEAARSLARQATPLGFFGHTHIPHLFAEEKGEVREFVYRQVELNPAKRYFINVGSVGQPRDGDPRAAYAIYDDAARTVELRRVAYDVAAAQAKIAAAELPARLAARLAEAR
jgi:diadenosine tetraphosphatase ApaH/serine/threonine PP2A family protein phosphatase